METNLEKIRKALLVLTKFKSKVLGIYRLTNKEGSRSASKLVLFVSCHGVVYKLISEMALAGISATEDEERRLSMQIIKKEDYNAHILAMSDEFSAGDKKLVPIYDSPIEGGFITTGKEIKDNALFGGLALIDDDTEVIILEDICIVVSEDKLYKGFYWKHEAFNIESL